jgi:phosphatidyl-myo-inositol dimannoside synthase
VQFRVVTFSAADASPDLGRGSIRRVRGRGPRTVAVAQLNAIALAESRSWRPDVVLSGHVVMSPAASMTGVSFVQYLYAMEMSHRPRLTAFAVRNAADCIVLGEHGRALASAAGASNERIHAIPPGIDVPSGPTVALQDRASLIVNVARLEDRYKGIDVLVRALPLVRSRVPDATMTLVGDGPLRHAIDALARANGCGEAVCCVGSVPDDERDSLLAAAAVFAMPSRLSAGAGGEGFGIVYLEAGARGIPVVAGNVGGALDAVLDEETGVLVDPEDHIAVAEAICRLLLDRDRAARLGDGGRRWAQRFEWPAVVRQVEDVLLGALERRP